MQFTQGKPSVGIVFDADFGDSIDDVLALALLNGLQGKNEGRLISLSVSKPSLKAAEFCQAVYRFYEGEPQPGTGFGGGSLAIGLATAGKMADDTPMMTDLLGKQSLDGKPLYPRSIERMNQTADPVALIRNAYSAQFDQNAITILAGPPINLARLLQLPPSKALIAQKCKYLVVAAGSFANGPADPALQSDIAMARRLFAEWPTPIIACGSEVGAAVPFPGSSIEKDFAWAPAHPVVDAYKAYKPMPYDAPATAVAAVLYAVRPQENYFKLSEPGTITVLEDGRTRFTPSADGKHKYLIADPAQKDKVTAAYVELASAKPAPRPQRFRPGQKKQADAPKKQDVPEKKQE